MPTTQTPQNACNTAVFLADQFGVDKDITGQSTEVDPSFENTLGEFKVFGDQAKYRLQCGQDSALKCKAVFTMDTDGVIDLLDKWYHQYPSQARHARVIVPSNQIGAKSYEGYYLLESYDFALVSDQAGPIIVNYSLKPNGPVQVSAVATS